MNKQISRLSFSGARDSVSSMTSSVVIVIGASRGIGRQIAITLAKEGFTVVVAAKSSSPSPSNDSVPDPNSRDSTIDTVASEIEKAGGKAYAHQVDVRTPSSIAELISWTISTLGGIDSIIYNPGAIFWASVLDTPVRRYELMHEVNTLGLYITVQTVLPHFYSRGHGNLIIVSPPIYSRFPRGKTAYAMTKFAMTTLMIGLYHDFKRRKVQGFNGCVCSIWPATGILSAATEFVRPGEHENLRKPEIFADAILAILKEEDVWRVCGKAWLDEDYLRTLKGVSDFDQYAVIPGTKVRRIMPKRLPSLEVEEEDDEGNRLDSTQLRIRKEKAKL
jgi:NAD(P)-dependent dehydrogenase (short-subunit alcohol dehydrogenase family)